MKLAALLWPTSLANASSANLAFAVNEGGIANWRAKTKMQGVARNFFTLALIYALAGMALGIHMGLSQDHSQMPVHAHALVAGWLMSSVFAFFYHLFPKAGAGWLAQLHFWLTAVSGIGLLAFLSFVLAGNQSLEPMVGMSSLLFYAAMLVFVVIALPAVYRRPA